MKKYSVQLFNGEELAQCDTLDEAIEVAMKQYRVDKEACGDVKIDPLMASEGYYFIDNNETLLSEAIVTRSGAVIR